MSGHTAIFSRKGSLPSHYPSRFQDMKSSRRCYIHCQPSGRVAMAIFLQMPVGITNNKGIRRCVDLDRIVSPMSDLPHYGLQLKIIGLSDIPGGVEQKLSLPLHFSFNPRCS